MLGTLTLPLSALELREAVRQARRIDPARLDRVLRFDEGRGHVEAQACASWEGIVGRIEGTREEAMAAWRGLGTIGEALAANAPGPDGRPVAVHVESLALVTPDGELRRVSRECHPELFRLVLGGHGVFGALYSATLSLRSLAEATRSYAAPERLELPASGAPRRSLELLVPPAALPAFLAEARGRCDAWRMPVEVVEVRRTIADRETALRWAKREYAAVRLELAERRTLGGSVRATQVVRELLDLAIALGGSFPIAGTPEATREQLERCYPELKGLLAEKRRLDPADKLENGWYLHHRSLLAAERCESRWNGAPATAPCTAPARSPD